MLKPARFLLGMLMGMIPVAANEVSDGFVLLPSLIAETESKTTSAPAIPSHLAMHETPPKLCIALSWRLVLRTSVNRFGPPLRGVRVAAEDW